MEENNTTPGFTKKSCSCGKTDEAIDCCEICNSKPIGGMFGWVCPVCGRGNSPFSSSCPCIPFSQFPIYPTCGPYGGSQQGGPQQ